MSNLDLYIDTAFRTSSKLAPEWASADYNDRQELQYMVFPDGIYYNRKKDQCRTPRVNDAFRHFARLARFSGEKEKRELQFELLVPSSVGSTGEMSTQMWDDLVEIYKVAKKLYMRLIKLLYPTI